MKLPLRVLHLEDDIRDAELAQDTLEADGITSQVRRVDTETDFRVALDGGGFEIILADYALPGFDGLSALKIAQQRSPHIPFIFVSGALGEDVAIEALKSGATDCVVKSGLPRLGPSVKRALREARERTERSHAEKALRRTEAYLAEAQRLSHTGSFRWDVSSGEIYWSEETFRIFEYDPATTPTVERVLQCTHPDDRARVRRLIERADQERQGFDFEHRLLMPDGSVKYVRVVGRPSTEAESGQVEFVGAVTDITERQRAEAERQAHLRFLESLDRVNQAIQGHNDLEQMMRAVLEAVLSIFGCDRTWLVYPCEPEAPAWRAVMEQTRPEFSGAFARGLELPVDPEVTEVFRRARASGGALRFGPGYELAVPAGLAERFSIQSILALAVFPKWDRPYLFGLHQCASTRTWTTEEERLFEEIGRRLADALSYTRLYRDLQERESRIRRLVDSNIIGIVIWNFDGDIIDANEAFLQMLGYDREDLLSRRISWVEITPAELRHRDQQAIEQLKTTGIAQSFQKEYFRKDGTRVPVLLGAAIFEAGGNEGVAFVVDLTEQKRSEEALLRSKTYLAQAQRMSQTGNFWWRVSSGELVWSEELYRILGYDQTAVPSAELVFQRVHPEDYSIVKNMVDRVAREGFNADFAYRLLMPDGSIKHLHIMLETMNGESADREFIGTVMDITARKNAEEALQAAQAELARVARITTLGELSASIAHEISQPLGAVVNHASACLRWLNAQNLEEARRSATLVVEKVHRAGEIIGRIRALAAKTPPQKDWLDINLIIAEVVALAGSALQHNHASLRTVLADDLPSVCGDRIQLQQVLLNLIVNAVEAMSQNSEGRREIQVSSQRVAEVASVSNGFALYDEASDQAGSTHVLVAVEDSGPGLDPRRVEQIFDAFYTTKPQGLGMGLAISRSIVEAHGGRLWASNTGQGSVFQFALPVRGGRK